ncbi:MAG: RNA helicase [Pleopsidium flavum]|nr:MAG: RNA helicase [Pleopsidium flavum]
MITQRVKTRYGDLKKIITERLDCLAVNLKDSALDSALLGGLGLKKHTFEEPFRDFQRAVIRSFSESISSHGGSKEPPMFESLRQAYIDRGSEGLDAQLKYAFYGHVASSRFTESDVWNQAKLADLRYPVEWYPSTRTVQRTLHLHVGPTNSGKTYHALKKLEEAETGVYAGPLRLLAHEVYTRLNAKGKPCNLITGDDRKLAEGSTATMGSYTVEMVPLNVELEVAVIDEIQMIGNLERGWAWTQALLGLRAKEVHLCGEERAVPLIRELAAAMGEKLVIHHYQRLSPLRTMTTSLKGDLKKLRKGDCLVVFSRMAIHALRREIEKATGKRVAVVYGSLPPETRAQQARLFNDPDNDYDILVASDAIGMGLNLSIKRIVFESTLRHDGTGFKTLQISDIKQIAGRAGRFRTAAQDASNETSQDGSRIAEGADDGVEKSSLPTTNLGLVTSLEKDDLPVIQEAMQMEAQPLLTAGLLPPAPIVQRFATYFPKDTPFSYILLRLHEITQMHPRFHLCSLRDQLEIADVIQPFKHLTISDRYIFCAAPVSLRARGLPLVLKAFAKCVAEQTGGALLDIPGLELEILNQNVTADKEYLRQLETLHKSLVLYLWLSYRFAGVFTSKPMASYAKQLVEERIDKVLADYAHNESFRKKMKTLRDRSMVETLKRQLAAKGQNHQTGETVNALPLRWADIPPALSVDDARLPDVDQLARAA